VGRSLGDILTKEGLDLVLNATATAVRREGGGIEITASVEGHERRFRADRLLIAAGRRPNTDAIAIEPSGVQVSERGAVVVDPQLRTTVAHIFAAGDVVGTQHGSQMATPVGSRQGGLAARNALSSGPAQRVDHRGIPRVIFTDPEVAVVGMTEAQAIAAGHRCWCNTVPMSIVPRAAAIRDTRGLIKMTADTDSHEVLGVAMVGHGAGEVIHEAAMAMRFRATLHDFIDLLHVFPTMAEALKTVALSHFKNPAKLSCCAE
jgi:mercuric reductase